MNLEFLKKLARKNPALARLINSGIISASAYAVSCVMYHQLFSMQGLVVAFLAPIGLYLDKVNRNKNKNKQ